MEKLPLTFLAGATEAAINSLRAKTNGTCTVSCTSTCTVFLHEGKYVVSPGNLHDKVDAPYCIEFDLRFNHGEVYINSQRIYQ